MSLTRRAFLASSLAAGTAGFDLSLAQSADTPRSRPPKRAKPAPKKVAVLTSIYRYLSHSYHIAGRFLDGYMKGDEHHFPDFGVASCYVEQVGKNDLSRELAKEHNFRISDSIEDALTLGTGKLAVDGVLLICEHGDYPYNARGQKLYPRHEYFKQVVAVFEKSGKTVPVFCDKHLSYDRKKGADMVETAQKMRFPLMAGSSLPVTWRRPELEFALGTKMSEALVASRGELEIYGIHALETLQCMVERRFTVGMRGYTVQGVKAVTAMQGDAVWKAGDDGLWSWELLEHALGRSASRNAGDIRANCKRFPRSPTWDFFKKGPIAFLIEYRDGLKAHDSATGRPRRGRDLRRAGRWEGEAGVLPLLAATSPGAAFLEALSSHVETFLATGKPPYPVERTQLTGGILDYALESLATNSKRLETPDLEIRYDPAGG